MKNLKHQKIRRHLQSPMQRQAYAHAIRYISIGMAVMLFISPQMQEIINSDFLTNPAYAVYEGITDIITDNSDIEETQESKNEIKTLTTSTTNVVPVTSVTTTTTITTTTTVVTTEEPTEPPSEEVVEEEIIEEYYEEDIYEEEYIDEYYEEEEEYDESYYGGTYTAKWYPGSVGSYGYSGRDLISGYSVASPDFPQGTILYITGGGLDGEYRVDDTGCPSGVIDFFYYYGEVPSHFEYNGVYQIEVSVIG